MTLVSFGGWNFPRRRVVDDRVGTHDGLTPGLQLPASKLVEQFQPVLRAVQPEYRVGRKHPVMVRRAALRLTSTSRVWALLHHTGAQYSAGAYTSARVDVLNVGVLAPQLVPARRRINAVRAMTLPRSAVRWSRYVSVLSSFTPR